MMQVTLANAQRQGPMLEYKKELLNVLIGLLGKGTIEIQDDTTIRRHKNNRHIPIRMKSIP